MLLDSIQSRTVFRAALDGGFAFLAINADSPAAITDVLEAARAEEAPVMIEASLWQLTGHSFGCGDPMLGMARYLVQIALLAASERYGRVPVLFHTDHIRGPQTLPLLEASLRGLSTGISGAVVSPSTLSVDSSAFSETQNIEALVRLGRVAGDCGNPVTLEMEAGVDDGVTELAVAERLLGGVEEQTPGTIHLWAPGVGTRHGLGEQGGFSPEAVRAHQQTASRVLGRPVGIALHGSSGLEPDALKAAVSAGVVKVNWSSESLRIRSQSAQEYYLEQQAALTPGHPHWKSAAMDHGVQAHVASRYQPRVVERIRLLGASGQAGRCRRLLGLE